MANIYIDHGHTIFICNFVHFLISLNVIYKKKNKQMNKENEESIEQLLKLF